MRDKLGRSGAGLDLADAVNRHCNGFPPENLNLGLLVEALADATVAEAIQSLYGRMRERFHEVLASRWSGRALDFMFANPIFRNSRFTSAGGIPGPTAHGLVGRLVGAGLLRELQPAAGRRAGLYAFEPLLQVVREPA